MLILVSTLVVIDIVLSHAKRWPQPLDDVLESVPVLLVDHGQVVESNLRRERIAEDDVLETARANFGIERMSQVKYAILERNGAITVIPRELPWGIRDENETRAPRSRPEISLVTVLGPMPPATAVAAPPCRASGGASG